MRRRFGLLFAGVAALIVLIAAIAFFFRPTAPPKPAAVAGQTLAILPFKPLLPTDRNESLEMGMTESLISSLGRYSPQAIKPLSSVRRYAALDQDVIAAGRELGVDTVLDGSLQRRGDRLRVSVRLLRVADGKQLWAQNFDQEFTTIFDLQDVIAERVAQALAVRWAGGASTRGAPYTRDPEAYALYASGQFAWTRQTEPGQLQAIAFFEQAIARDPNYALAYTGLADSYAVLGVFGIRAPKEVFPTARQAVEKALSIDPDLAAAHSALGHIKVQYEYDWDGAAREYARAIQLDPTLGLDVSPTRTLVCLAGGHRSRGGRRATGAAARAALAGSQGRGRAISSTMRSVTTSRSGVSSRFSRSTSVQTALARILIRDLIAKGDSERALRELDKRPIQAPGSNAFRAEALALSGRRKEALAELDRVLKLSRERYVAAYDIALIYAALADTEHAFQWLERAIEDRSTLIDCHGAGSDARRITRPIRGLLRSCSELASIIGPCRAARPLVRRVCREILEHRRLHLGHLHPVLLRSAVERSQQCPVPTRHFQRK